MMLHRQLTEQYKLSNSDPDKPLCFLKLFRHWQAKDLSLLPMMKLHHRHNHSFRSPSRCHLPALRETAHSGAVRKSKVKEVPLSEVKDDLSRFLREAETQDVVITRHGKPAGVLIGFKSEDDWFDYRLEHDPRFIQRVEQARASFRVGRGVKLEDVK